MIKNNLIAILTYVLIGVCSFLIGRFSSQLKKPEPVGHHGEKPGAEAPKGHDHGGHAEASPDNSKLSNEMKINMGIIVKEIERKVVVKNIEVPALIRANENNSSLLTSYASGLVKKLTITEGAFVKKGAVLGVLTRDALPSPEYDAIKDYFHNKNIEMLLIGLNQSKDESLDFFFLFLTSIGLDKSSLQIIKKMPVVDQREAIFLQITDKAGLWQNDLKQYYQKLSNLPGTKIPEMIPSLVMINRLGLLDDLKKEIIQQYCKNKKEVMVMLSLIQNNNSIDYLTQFASNGYLTEEIVLTAPIDGHLSKVYVKVGQSINNREMLFKIAGLTNVIAEAHLRGSEVVQFRNAISKNDKIYIKNIQNNTQIQAEFTGLNSMNEGELTVEFSIINSLIANTTNSFWQYLPGDNCVLLIPEKSFEASLVLPREAVIEEGFKRFVFMESGDAFEKVEITTLFMDKHSVVLDSESSLYEGDRIVIFGAYELNLATKKPEKSGGDGHSHSH